jgi:flagellar basal-body rod modification protein FlgD
MQITATNSATESSKDGIEAIGAQASQLMGQEDFIKLLVTQMTSQDPLNPMSNQDMLTQMVQFSTLQQNTALQSGLARMETSQLLTQATALIGRQVSLQTDSGTLAQGIVTGVDVSSEMPQLVVNGVTYDLSQVLAIAPAPVN